MVRRLLAWGLLALAANLTAAEPNSLLQMRAGQLLEWEVHTYRGETLGAIERVVLDSDRRTPYAVVKVGGFLGLGGMHIAVPVAHLVQGRDALIIAREVRGEEVGSEYPYKEEAFLELPDETVLTEAVLRNTDAVNTRVEAGSN